VLRDFAKFTKVFFANSATRPIRQSFYYIPVKHYHESADTNHTFSLLSPRDWYWVTSAREEIIKWEKE